MSFGLRIFGPSGETQLDENSFTMRLVLSTLVSFSYAKSYQDFSVPGCTPDNALAFVIPNTPLVFADRQLETEMLSGIARVYNYTRGFDASYISTTTMRLIVVRFK